MERPTILYFLFTSVLLTLAPGPDNLYLLAKSLADGAKSGFALTLGLASGVAFHTALVILGVAALVRESPAAFTALKYLGAIYLLYLAAGAFRATGRIKMGQAGARASYLSLYRQGVFMNVLNPCSFSWPSCRSSCARRLVPSPGRLPFWERFSPCRLSLSSAASPGAPTGCAGQSCGSGTCAASWASQRASS